MQNANKNSNPKLLPKLIPDAELYSRITNKIAYERQLVQLKRRLFLYAGSFIGSFFALVFIYRAFSVQLSQTGFFEFLRLISTDFSAVSAHLNDYILSLVESLPVISFGFVCATFAAVLLTLTKFFLSVFELKKLRIN